MSHSTASQSNPIVPLPSLQKKRLVQAEIRQDLFDAVQKEIAREKLKIRQVCEWGMAEWLFKTNPAEAKRLKLR